MKEHVFALHHIHGHVSEAYAILHEVGDGLHRLHHLVHEQKLLSVLQVPLGQVHVGARVDGSALWREQRRNGLLGADPACRLSTELFSEHHHQIDVLI